MTTSERIAANYRTIRKRFGYSLSVAAGRAQDAGYRLSKSWLSAIENGRRPGDAQLDALAASLGVDVSLLTMPVQAAPDDSTPVQGAPVQHDGEGAR